MLGEGSPLELRPGDTIPLRCTECGRPWRSDNGAARAYVCPCGSTSASTCVTFTTTETGEISVTVAAELLEPTRQPRPFL